MNAKKWSHKARTSDYQQVHIKPANSSYPGAYPVSTDGDDWKDIWLNGTIILYLDSHTRASCWILHRWRRLTEEWMARGLNAGWRAGGETLSAIINRLTMARFHALCRSCYMIVSQTDQADQSGDFLGGFYRQVFNSKTIVAWCHNATHATHRNQRIKNKPGNPEGHAWLT